MKEYNIFVASSIKESVLKDIRDTMPVLVDSVNTRMKSFNISYKCDVFGTTEGANGDPDTQGYIDDELIGKSDLFVLILKNNKKIGQYTIGEFIYALKKKRGYKRHNPLIKIYIIQGDKKERISIEYESEDFKDLSDLNVDIAECKDFEDILSKVGGYYADCVTYDTFSSLFFKYLTETFPDQMCKYSQSEISYQNHLLNTGQNNFRIADNKYFRREGRGGKTAIDDKMEEIIKRSSLLILEGNAFSGKTRAAYELMRSMKEWQDGEFFIYKCGSGLTIDDLNHISFNTEASQKNKIIFIDDINEVIKNDTNIDRRWALWQNLNYISAGGNPIRWPKTTLIMTVAGKLSSEEKSQLYQKIFGTENYIALQETLKTVTVNFDIYDPGSFAKMVNSMVKAGFLIKDKIRPGNYTIGSLFIDENKVRNSVRNAFEEGETMKVTLRSIRLNWLYASNDARGKICELKRIFKFLKNEDVNKLNHPLDICIDKLRSQGLLIISGSEIKVDVFVIEAINYVLAGDDSEKIKKDVSDLLKYAEKICTDSEYRIEGCQEIHSIEHMAYRICEKADLKDEVIRYLISLVFEKSYGKKQTYVFTEDVLARMMGYICSKNKDIPYPRIFCATAVVNFSKSETSYKIFEKVDLLLKDKKVYPEGCKVFFKELAYKLLSSQSNLAAGIKDTILSRIYDADSDKMIEPFSEDDLKGIVNLKRMIPYLNKGLPEIVEMVKSIEDFNDLMSEIEPDPLGLDDQEIERNDDTKLKRTFLSQLGKTVIEVFKTTVDIDGFNKVMQCLETNVSENLKKALDLSFTLTFYSRLQEISSGYSYADRFKLFDYILNLNKSYWVIESIQQFTVDAERKEKADDQRIKALNNFLPLLDRSDALKAYREMKEKKLYDGHTFSILMNNPFLRFEHLFDIAREEGDYLIYNQLLREAKTIDDAKMCFRMIGIDAPYQLKDEYALGEYINIENVDYRECVDIIKKWKSKHNNKDLSAVTLSNIVQKMSFVDLRKIYETKRETEIGLSDNEVNIILKNPICINKLFVKAANNKEIGKFVQQVFEGLLNDGELKKVIIDNRYNENTSVLSAYLRHPERFEKYSDVKEYGDKFLKEHSDTLQKTVYIYRSYLWRVVHSTEIVDKRKEVNALLKEAYDDLMQIHSNKNDVTKDMSKLYQYLVQSMNEEDIDKSMDYAYENKDFTGSFVEFLDYLLNNTTEYVNEVFVFETLKLMQNKVNDEILDRIRQIIRKNKIVIELDSVGKLSEDVKCRILDFDNGEIKIDSDIVSDFSEMKLLCWLMDNQMISYEDADLYLSNKGEVKITQTYLNAAFQSIKNEKDKQIAYNKMQYLMDKYVKTDSPLFKSIQMFLAMVYVVKNENQLKEVLQMFPDGLDVPQGLMSVMNKYIYLADSDECIRKNLLTILKTLIAERPEIVNIQHINNYLRALVSLYKNEETDNESKKEIETDLWNCWNSICESDSVNVNELLHIPDSTSEKWIIGDVNVQTYIYFPMFARDLPQIINEKFGGDYFYSDNKDCLNDFIKNCDYFWKSRYKDEMVDLFAKLLNERTNDNNYKYGYARKQILKTKIYKQLNGRDTDIIHALCRKLLD